MTIPTIVDYDLAAIELPKNQVSWQLNAQRAALLVHDMQDYFLAKFNPEGPLIAALRTHCRQLLQTARQLQLPVFFTAQLAEQPAQDRALLNDFWGPGLTAHPEQVAILDELTPAADEIQIAKWRYSAFQRSDLRQYLHQKQRDQLIICGVYSHIGCLATALEAFMQDIQPFLITDGCADFSLAKHQQAVNYVAEVCGVSLNCQQALQQLSATKPSRANQVLHNLLEPLLNRALTSIAPNQDLTLLGLDSIRLMLLTEQLQQQGYSFEFEQLRSTPTWHAWQQLMQQMEVVS